MANPVAVLTIENERALLSGEIDFDNVNLLYQKGLSYINSFSNIHIDFSAVTHCNSAAIALMVEWLKLAKLKNKSIQFHHLPAAVTSMLALAKMEGIFN